MQALHAVLLSLSKRACEERRILSQVVKEINAHLILCCPMNDGCKCAEGIECLIIEPGCPVKRFGQGNSLHDGIECLLIGFVELNPSAELLAKIVRKYVFG